MSRKYAPGDRISFGASFINNLVELTEERERFSSSQLSGNNHSTVIKVKNVSGGNREYNDLLALGKLLYEDNGKVGGDMLGRFRRGDVVLEAKTVDLNPQSEEISRSFCVLKDSLRNNDIGEAYVFGLAAVRLNVANSEQEDYKWAVPGHGKVSLDMSPVGMFEVLWKEEGSGESARWGFVDIGRESYIPPLFEATSNASGGTIKAKRVASTGVLVGSEKTFNVLE